MTNKLIDIKDFKEEKKNKLILSEVKDMIVLLDKTSKELFKYKKYRYIMEILSVLETNKSLLQIAYDKNMKVNK